MITAQEALRRCPGAVEFVHLLEAVDEMIEAIRDEDADALEAAEHAIVIAYHAIQTRSYEDDEPIGNATSHMTRRAGVDCPK